MPNNRVNEIDFLRFLAALAVVFFHYSFRGHAADSYSIMDYAPIAPAGKYGYLGVHLFFMISGFVILMTASSGSLRRFIISRMIRLYPAFWVCCTLTFAATMWIGAPRFSADLGQFGVNLTMMSKFLGVESIDGAYWSLFVEIKFYLIVVGVLILRQIHRTEALLAFWAFSALALHYLGLRGIGKLFLYDSAGFLSRDALVISYGHMGRRGRGWASSSWRGGWPWSARTMTWRNSNRNFTPGSILWSPPVW